MKTYELGPIVTITAGEALYKNRFVDCLGLTTVNLKALGVTLFDCASGGQATVQNSGIAVVIAGGSITAGNHVSMDANGAAVALTIDNVDDIPKNCGVAMDDASSGGYLRVALI